MAGKKKTRRNQSAGAGRYVAQVYDTKGALVTDYAEFRSFEQARAFLVHMLSEFQEQYPRRKSIGRAIDEARRARKPFIVNVAEFQYSVIRVPSASNPVRRRKAPARKKAAPRKKRATKKKTARRSRNPIDASRVGYVVYVTGKSATGYVSQYVPPRNALLVMNDRSAHPFTKGQAELIAADLSKIKGTEAKAVRANPGRKKKRVNPSGGGPEADDALREAAAALEEFSGHEARHVEEYVLFGSEAAWALGPVAAIEYIARRDGETAVYRHEFAKRARPLLASGIDGRQLYMLGGAYSVTDRGIVDDA